MRTIIYEYALLQKGFVDVNDRVACLPSLLQSARQIRVETLPIFHSGNTFEASINPLTVSESPLFSWADLIGSKSMAMVVQSRHKTVQAQIKIEVRSALPLKYTARYDIAMRLVSSNSPEASITWSPEKHAKLEQSEAFYMRQVQRSILEMEKLFDTDPDPFLDHALRLMDKRTDKLWGAAIESCDTVCDCLRLKMTADKDVKQCASAYAPLLTAESLEDSKARLVESQGHLARSIYECMVALTTFRSWTLTYSSKDHKADDLFAELIGQILGPTADLREWEKDVLSYESVCRTQALLLDHGREFLETVTRMRGNLGREEARFYLHHQSALGVA